MVSFVTQPIACPACRRAVIQGLGANAPLCVYERDDASVYSGLAATTDEVGRVFANVRPACHDLRLAVFGADVHEDAVAQLSKLGLNWTYRW